MDAAAVSSHSVQASQSTRSKLRAHSMHRSNPAKQTKNFTIHTKYIYA